MSTEPETLLAARAGLAIDAGACLARAEAETGLSDHGDETLKDRFRILVDKINASGMDAEGLVSARETLHTLLGIRLRFIDDHQRYGLDAEKVVRPLIATGEPRSGTTLLHALLAQDPNGRSLEFWEVMRPSPPPGLATQDDRRIADADADWREILDRIPKWIVSHPYNDMLGRGLPECERTWAMDFRHTYPTAWWRVPMMPASGLPQDEAAQYRIHKMMLQHAQHGRDPKYWTLKGTSHHLRLASLFEVYPDAQVIWTHRDPVQSVASRIQLLGEIAEAIDPRIDWKAFGKGIVEGCRGNFKAMAEEPLAEDPRIVHVLFSDMMKNPVGRLRAAYDHFGLPSFTDETAVRIQAWLDGNTPDRYGKFVYSLDLIGEDIEALYEEFAPYMERFGVPRDTKR
jgi:Sulfotransferase family